MAEFKGFVKIPFCSTETGKECAEIIKTETQGAYVCGEEWPKSEDAPKGSKCPICGKPAKKYVYLAKSY